MGCAVALQGGCEQRGLWGFLTVGGVDFAGVPSVARTGVAVPDVVGVGVDCKTSSLSCIPDRSDCVIPEPAAAVPPRRGERRCKVDEGGRARSATVLEGDRWRPAWSNRTSEGSVVDAERKFRTSEMVLVR